MTEQTYLTLRPSEGLKLVLETDEGVFLVGYFASQEMATKQRAKVLTRNPGWAKHRWLLIDADGSVIELK